MSADRLLFVDDDAITLKILSVKFRNRFEIHTASSGADALAVVRDSGPFAVVVSDLCMPEMDGVELLGRLKDLAPRTVRILMTAMGERETMVTSINEVEIFRFIPKPINSDFMLTVLEKGVKKYCYSIRMSHQTFSAI